MKVAICDDEKAAHKLLHIILYDKKNYENINSKTLPK